MPRNSSKPSLIQKIATQAQVTFKNCDDGKDLLANLAELSALLSDIRAADLNIAPPKRKGSGSGTRARRRAPVTYMHICETRAFSMGVFALRSGVSIPLHDHPGMNGMLKVLYGKVRIRCFDKLDGAPDPDPDPGTVSGAGSETVQKDAVCLAALRSSGEFTQQSAPCVLSPLRDNLHQIDALDGPAAFLDILAPPYDPDDGRDCHYYRVLRTASKNGDDKQGEETAWLLEIPQPEEFWCGGEPYPGPKVTV
ncbi:2-aminoethanethiol (cysteamine) dioxygenase a [Pangasianodon hypophthalmus]|uniref:2-aminoethanethiol (cysteamine) dioxygenase a n=1 Tax=Pangasianodon hypophthalmus TaxID=310915 RepID=UPI000EFF599B|nr:2-aminoethanethiol (cysteamine) dioxygenase a [Pangasianodon hypophthalmus]